MDSSTRCNIERVFSREELKGVNNVSVYSNEFDLSMIRIFFPHLTCKSGYIKDSCSFSSILTGEISSLHKISISRKKLESDIFEHILLEESPDKNNDLYIHILRGDPQHIEENECTKIINCSYISSLFPPGNKSPLQITNVGLYSVTSSLYSKKLCDLIRNKKTPRLILDGTACVGGDTIGFFAHLKCSVIGIEKDDVNFEVLQNNVRAYDTDKIKVVHGDFLVDGYSIIQKDKPDMIYFDPPWGGRDYSIQKELDLFLGGVNVKEIVSYILNTFPFVNTVVLKVPLNFKCRGASSSDGELVSQIFKMNKFNIIFIERSWLQPTLTDNYPLSVWVPPQKKERKNLPQDLYTMEYKSLHWGQRKLHLSEVDFFTNHTNMDEKYIVVYAGAANGQHIPLLLKLFPNLEFHLYDPAPFSSVVLKCSGSSSEELAPRHLKCSGSSLEELAPRHLKCSGSSSEELAPRHLKCSGSSIKINPHKDSSLPLGFFTDEIAHKYKDTKNLLFICDIRLAPSDKNNSDYESLFEKNVDNDMAIQKEWVKIMNPKSSILKMRIPYNIKSSYEYLSGEIRFQMWAPVASTETRLIVNDYKTHIYDPEKYEKQCAYYNNRVRQTDISDITFKSRGIEIDGKFSDLWGEYGIFINSDCYLETRVFYEYLKSRGVTDMNLSTIKSLIDETSKWLYENVEPKNAFSKKKGINNRKEDIYN